MPKLNIDGISVPVAERCPITSTIHGQTRIDNFKYFEDLNGKTRNYIQTENNYAELILGQLSHTTELLYEEMKTAIDLSYDWPMSSYRGNDYFYRVTQGQGYEAYYRSNSSGEQLLLDLNDEARGYSFFVLGQLEISPDNKTMAYSIDTKGDERYRIFVRDIESRKTLDRLDNVDSSIVWANDNKTIYYVTLDPTMRPFRVYRHRLGAHRSTDQLIYEETDQQFFLGLDKSSDDKYIFIVCSSHTTTEVRLMNSDGSGLTTLPLIPRQSEIEYQADHNDHGFFILTNHGEPNFRLVRIPDAVASHGTDETELFKPGEGIYTQSFDLFRNHLVLWESDESSTRIRVKELTGSQEEYFIPLPERLCRAWVVDGQESDAPQLRFEYSTLVNPNTVYDWDFKTRTLATVKVRPIKNYQTELYESERLYATAHDGEIIPITLLSPRGCDDGPQPMFLYGYGAYGDMYNPEFDAKFISLLNRGIRVGIAHIRGGRYRADRWYKLGKMLNKKNTFKDFIACAEFLINERYTSREQLVIHGRSAGGLLMGAVVNMRPDLFRAVITEVPFVDVINTMLNPNLPLTVAEYNEWGNPNLKEFYDYMASYDPCSNVSLQYYPWIFVTCGENDMRVSYHEPLKWVALLRAHKTDNNPLLLRVENKGHGKSDDKFKYLKDWAEKFAFILAALEPAN